jgi:thiamine biosynthesis lipoprotein
MINFGGQIAVRGELRVTIADPENRERAVLAFTMRDASLSTSSGSEKTFAIGGRRFSHIVDPRSGEALPPRGSVSVIDDRALDADILSTALYVMGEDEGLRWADAHGVAAVFINPSHQIRLSERAREHVRELELLDRRFSVKE